MHGEETSFTIENSAGSIHVGVEGVGFQKKLSFTYEIYKMSIAKQLNSFSLLLTGVNNASSIS